MLVLPVPRSPVHRLCVNERSDVIGANPGRATLTSLICLWYLLYSFRDGVLLRARISKSSSVAVIPLADLGGGRQAFQWHADWPRHMSHALGA